MGKYYVYELIDPRTDEVFYVGKGCGPRIDAHEKEARAGRVSRKCDRIRAIEAEGLSIVKRKVKHFADEQDAYDYEADRIDEIGHHRLTNIHCGGGRGRYYITIQGDRDFVRAAAGVFNRTRNGRFSIRVMGEVLDIQTILASYKDLIGNVASRRGMDWVNEIARRQGVEFRHGSA